MTLRDLLEWFSQYPEVLAGLFVLPPVLVLVSGFLHGKGNGGVSPWRYLYSVLIYLTSVPGMAAAVLTLYGVVFARENLLDMNILVSIAPIASMIVTLFLTSRNVEFDQIPGFDRLFGLMVVLAITFVIILGVAKTRIWLFFGSSIFALLILIAVLITVLNWGAKKAFGNR